MIFKEEELKILLENLKTQINDRSILKDLYYWYDLVDLIYFLGNYNYIYLKDPLEVE